MTATPADLMRTFRAVPVRIDSEDTIGRCLQRMRKNARVTPGQTPTGRESSKLTQVGLAKALGISQAHVSRIESEEISPPVELAMRWAELCGMEFSWHMTESPYHR